MTFGTIYSFGDTTMYVSALNAVAMIFNSPMFSGGSLIILAGLIALIFTVLATAATGKPNYIGLLIVALVYFGGIQPKMTLTVQDYYSGEVTNVDNIPLIVGMPASIAAEISYNLGSTIETAMTLPGSTTSFKDGGFVDPLKIVYSLRPSNTLSLSNDWNKSLEAYVRNCAMKSSAWDEKKALHSPNIKTYLLDGGALPVHGLTVDFNAAHPDGVTAICESERITLLAGTDLAGATPLLSAQGLSNLINKGSGQRATASTPATALGDLSNALNPMTAALQGAGQNAQTFIVNALAAQSINDGITCANATADAHDACLEKSLIFSAMDQAAIEQAAGASVFAKTVVPMMNIMSIFFFVFSPILLLVALMSPTKTVPILGGYVMFAIWTQSWLPTAMVINFIIEMQATTAFAQIANADGGLTIANMYDFYRMVSTKIGLASELFAMTPMLTMALLSGSAFGLTQLGGAMQQKDHINEKAASPDTLDNAPLANTGRLLKGEDRISDISTSGSNFSEGYRNASGSQTFQKLDVASAATRAVGVAESNLSTAQEQYGSQQMQAFQKLLGKDASTAYTQMTNANDSFSNSVGVQKIKTIASSLADKHGWSGSKRARFEASAGLSAALGGVTMAAGVEAAEAEEFAAALTETDSNGITHAQTLNKTFNETLGKTGSTVVNTALSNTKSDQLNAAKNKATQAQTLLTDAQTASRNAALMKSQDTFAWGAQAVIKSGGSAQGLQDYLERDLEGKELDAFRDGYKHNLTMIAATKGQYLRNDEEVAQYAAAHNFDASAALIQATGEADAGRLVKKLAGLGLLGDQSMNDHGIAATNKTLRDSVETSVAPAVQPSFTTGVQAAAAPAETLVENGGANVQRIEAAVTEAVQEMQRAKQIEKVTGTLPVADVAPTVDMTPAAADTHVQQAMSNAVEHQYARADGSPNATHVLTEGVKTTAKDISNITTDAFDAAYRDGISDQSRAWLYDKK